MNLVDITDKKNAKIYRCAGCGEYTVGEDEAEACDFCLEHNVPDYEDDGLEFPEYRE